MNEDLKFKIGNSFQSSAQIREEMFARADRLEPDTRKAYLSSISKLCALEDMKSKFQTIWSPLIGIVIILIILAVVLFTPDPTALQGAVIWTVLSFGMALGIYMASGFLEFKYGQIIRGSGGMAVFAVMFFYVPKMFDKLDSHKADSDKMAFYVASSAAPTLQKFETNYNVHSSEKILSVAVNGVRDYVGINLPDSSLTCYRVSDGKILLNESCKEMRNQQILILCNQASKKYENKHAAFVFYKSVIDSMNSQ